MILLSISTFALLSLTLVVGQSALEPIVDLGYIKLLGNSTSPTGFQNSNVTFFGGIPFAQPPVGSLRWREPITLNETACSDEDKELIDARGWGEPCVQRPGVGSEDCLTLNIWKPSSANKRSKLPVAVYIHGGGWGGNSPQGFPLHSWVSQSQDMIGVSMGYRLNIFGFLAGQALLDDPNVKDLNFGLLDQRAALEWLQRHVRSFGGDPDQVTIYGESAGGGAVVMQVTAYAGQQRVPFKRAVAQSIGYGSTVNIIQKEETYRNVTKLVGCPSTGAESLACLRALSTAQLIPAINNLPNARFDPIVTPSNASFLPDLPARLLKTGRFTSVEVMAGATTHDGRSFAGGRPADFISDKDVRERAFRSWLYVTNHTKDAVMPYYDRDFNDFYERAWRIAGEGVVHCMALLLAKAARIKGQKNVFLYRWNAPDTVLYNANPHLGAMHTSDLYYLFEGTNPIGNASYSFTPFNETESSLAKESIAYWTSFATTGSPSTGRLPRSPEWPTDEDSSRRRLVLSRPANGESGVSASVVEEIDESELERCDLWMGDDILSEVGV